MPTATGSYATTSALKSRLGITNATDDTLLGTVCDQVNQWIETHTGRILAPVASATYLFDGDGSRRLYVPSGVRAVSLLEVAPATGGSFTSLPAGDIFLRPLDHERLPGWPATFICLSDVPTGAYGYFPFGHANVRVTMTTGWAAIPDDVTDVALTIATRAWHARKSGQTDLVGNDETGAPIVSRFVSGRDRETLALYRSATRYGIG